MIIGMCRAIAVRYGRRPGAKRDLETRMVTTEASVSWVAKPSPGKCFIEGMTPPDSSPEAKAFDNAAVWTALNDHVRPCRYKKDEIVAGTSASGAKSTLMPSARKAAPALTPWVRATVVLSSRPICGGDSVGGAHGIRLIAPPSWSTAIRRRGWPPALAALWSVAVSVINAARVVMLEPNRMIPPISPREIRPSRLELGVVPFMRTTSFWPTRCASVGVAAVVVATVVADAPRVVGSDTKLAETTFEPPKTSATARSAAAGRRGITVHKAASRS